jgi:hydroxyacylglutathione hydrolase
MNLTVHTNSHLGTNTYFLHSVKNNTLLLIDPGVDAFDICNVIDRFRANNLYVLLTHHHFDHMYSLAVIEDRFSSSCNFMVYGNSACQIGASSAKYNLSEYSLYGPVSYSGVFQKIDDNCQLTLSGVDLEVFQTRGHTDSSVCYVLENKIFVGDLMIPGYKTVTNLPTGNRDSAMNSITSIINSYSQKECVVYPGHGTKFLLSSIAVEDFFRG